MAMYIKDTLKASISGNAGTATTLATARTINGTSFNGSANITTSTWGTARTLTIGSTGKSVNGSGNVSWSLSEIGAAASSHTHNYAGSSSAGGAANSVKTNLTIKLNGGSTEGTNLFTFNGGTAKTVNITPSAIGAAASSHGTHLTIGTGSSNAAAGNHTHNYAGSASAGGAANSVKTNLTIKLNGGSTEGSNLFTFNGSTAKTINITPSAIGAAASSHGTHLTIGTGSGNAAAGNHTHSYLPLSGGTVTGSLVVNGNIATKTGIFTYAQSNGVATSDGSTFVALFRYASSRGYCDLGSNTIPGRLYIRSGQGTAGSGVCVENKVTNGNAYMQYLSPEGGTIALTSHLSDRTKKENIVYVDSKDSEFTNKDFYNFIRDDLGLATYNYNNEYNTTDTHTKLNFIAQDILYDIENDCENKVGNLIVQTENAMRTQGNLRYDPEIYTSVLAGALKESINKIEELEATNKVLEELVYSLSERLSKLENK